MPKFRLSLDQKETRWWRLDYDIEAETLEEAIDKIKDGNNDDYFYSEEVSDCSEPMSIEENGGEPTCEILHDSKTVWNNKDGLYPNT